MITVLVCRVGQEPAVEKVDNDLESMYRIVGGYIEIVNIGGGYQAIVNEEGALIGLPQNACGFVGDFFFTKYDGEGDHISLTDDDIAACRRWYEAKREVRHPGESGVSVMVLPSLVALQKYMKARAEARETDFKKTQGG